MQIEESIFNTETYIGVVPTIGYSFEDMFSEKNTFFSVKQGRNPMCVVRENLESRGVILKDATKLYSPTGANIVLYFGNISTETLLRFKDSVNVYIASEPPAVDTTNDKNNLTLLKKYFDYLLSWNDDLVDETVFLKFNLSVDFFPYPENNCFQDKKLLTMISGNKTSNHINELYSKRLDIINYFEALPQDDFEFWGVGWDSNNYKNYRGAAVSKADIFKNYKFAVCFENQKCLNGYITEKILDCLICKIVPIYWGASNIEQYIPKGCYIDYRDFENIESLVIYLKSLSKEEYYSYIQKSERFLNSDGINKFTAEAFANVIMGLIDKKKRVHITPIKIFILRLIKIKIRIKNFVQTHGYIGSFKKIVCRINRKGKA